MTRANLTVAACATVLWAGTVLATATPQENCDKARITAWKKYASCVDTVVAKVAGCRPSGSCPASYDRVAAFAKCRHTYFKQWTRFQTKPSLATSTCIGPRLTDNGTTVSDNLSGLVWEKKTNDASVHDEGNTYSWSTGSPYDGNGTAFTSFLTGAVTGLNVAGFAGANDWRLPTLVELQTTVRDFTCTGAFGGPTCSCGATPCIDGTFGPTQSDRYWSATTYVSSPDGAWCVSFDLGYVEYFLKVLNPSYVRAVSGGL